MRSCQLSLNEFFDSNAPSMKIVDDGEKKRKKENNDVIASRPPKRQPTGTTHTRANFWVLIPKQSNLVLAFIAD